jgi:NAD(P)-dependent dehydrogenase (short-subunit alcohol dehydrogenase family)
MSSLQGKVAFITGAGSKRGMGHAIALRLAKEGADIVILDKYEAPKSMFPGDENWAGLPAEVKEIETLGKKALGLTMDIGNSRDIDEAIARTLETFGKIDILVHAAAIRGPVGVNIIDLSEKDIRALMDTNLVASFLVCKAVARTMVSRKASGKIVVICSGAGAKGVPGSSAYGAAKAGCISLVQSLALELAQYHINVNGINPQMFVTNLRDEAFNKMAKEQGISWEEARKKDQDALATRIPWGRLGTTDEIADLTYFLVSSQSDYMTGEVISLGGGIT